MRFGSLALSALLTGPLAAQQPPAAPTAPAPPEIVASAQGEARVTPDRARIFIGVQTRAATAAQAGAENARKQRAVLDTLRALGIAPEQLSTASYNVFPEQVYNPDRGDKAPRITGYNVVNSVRVEVRKVEMLGQLIDASLAKGANGIQSLDFYSSNADEARHSALASAVARARGDAEAMAKAAGGALGDLLEVSSVAMPEPRPLSVALQARAEAAPSTPITPGEQTLTVNVTARWRFVAGRK
jgi:uncharacterized protein YggE